MEVGSGDVGMPGDKYRIRLRIAGKYRFLASEKQEHLRMLSNAGPSEERFCGTSFPQKTMIQQRMLPRALSPAEVTLSGSEGPTVCTDPGHYHIVGSWNGWSPDPLFLRNEIWSTEAYAPWEVRRLEPAQDVIAECSGELREHRHGTACRFPVA